VRKRYLEDGNVFFKKLIPRDDVLDVREELAFELFHNVFRSGEVTFSIYSPHFASLGYLKPGTSPRDGIWNPASSKSDLRGIGSPNMTSKDTAMNSLVGAHTAPKCLGLLTHPTLLDMIRKFMDWHQEILLK